MLDLFKGNMIQRHPQEEGCSELQCAGAQEVHVKHAQPNTCRKDLELASLILTHLQHWRGQIIAAHARAPRCAFRHVQPMSQQTQSKLRDPVSSTEQGAHVQRSDEGYKIARTQGGGQDFSASYTLKARNIRRRIQHAIHKAS